MTDTDADNGEGSDGDVDSAGGSNVVADDGVDSGESTRDRLESEMDRVAEEFDQGVVDLLAWLLDTETRARIYVHLRQSPGSTSDEIADGTGLYPSTVRESLAELTDESVLERTKRQNEGAGNNPYEYTAIPPSDLVGGLVGQIQDELNAIVNLDQFLGDGDEDEERDEPVRIEVRDSED
jgi:predicted transcriptional regulator